MAVFGLAIGLAFALNGESDDGGGAAAAASSTFSTTPAPPTPTAAAPPGGDEPLAEPVGCLCDVIGFEADTAAPVAAEPPPPDEPDLTGFQAPLDGACLPEVEGHLPGAPREYRNGVHEGLDLYPGVSCAVVALGTPVLAAKDGVLLRADLGYQELTEAEYRAAEGDGFQGALILDMFRGRQVWIDHGAGVVTRYAHLSGIAAGLRVGQAVRAGQVIAFVGESGTPESLFAPGTDYHLHFEIRVGRTYLGAALPPLEARALYRDAFGLLDAGTAE